MRVFKSETAWDKIEQQWYQTFAIDGDTVDMETYCMELEHEQHDNEEGVIACNCDDCCECHCDECEPEEDIEEECFCHECSQEREQELINGCLSSLFECDIDECADNIIEIAYRFKELGMQEAKAEMREFLED